MFLNFSGKKGLMEQSPQSTYEYDSSMIPNLYALTL